MNIFSCFYFRCGRQSLPVNLIFNDMKINNKKSLLFFLAFFLFKFLYDLLLKDIHFVVNLLKVGVKTN